MSSATASTWSASHGTAARGVAHARPALEWLRDDAQRRGLPGPLRRRRDRRRRDRRQRPRAADRPLGRHPRRRARHRARQVHPRPAATAVDREDYLGPPPAARPDAAHRGRPPPAAAAGAGRGRGRRRRVRGRASAAWPRRSTTPRRRRAAVGVVAAAAAPGRPPSRQTLLSAPRAGCRARPGARPDPVSPPSEIRRSGPAGRGGPGCRHGDATRRARLGGRAPVGRLRPVLPGEGHLRRRHGAAALGDVDDGARPRRAAAHLGLVPVRRPVLTDVEDAIARPARRGLLRRSRSSGTRPGRPTGFASPPSASCASSPTRSPSPTGTPTSPRTRSQEEVAHDR